MVSLDLIEQALVAPCMDSVIAVTERYQYLDEHQGARVYTAYRELDHTLCVGFAQDLSRVERESLEVRGFVLFGEREGTKREHRLLLMTLKEIGFSSTYGSLYFTASKDLLRHLSNLGWPLGGLSRLAEHPRCAKDGSNTTP